MAQFEGQNLKGRVQLQRKFSSKSADLGLLLEPLDEGQEELALQAPLVQLIRVPATVRSNLGLRSSFVCSAVLPQHKAAYLLRRCAWTPLLLSFNAWFTSPENLAWTSWDDDVADLNWHLPPQV